MWDLRTVAHFQGSEMSPGLLQDFMDGYILPPLLVQLSSNSFDFHQKLKPQSPHVNRYQNNHH